MDTKNETLNYGIMAIEDVYKLAREFLKAKEGTKAINLSYDDRNMINVLSKQAFYGKYDEGKITVGFLDLVGKDRVQLWKSMENLSKEEAMNRYINLITKVCPVFYAHLEAHKSHLEEEQNRLKQKEEEGRKQREMSEQKEKKLREEDLRLMEDTKKKREEIQRKQIQEALNQQTYPHFKAYAEQQHPNNPQAQEELIKQLQEQHFEQYMNQVYQQQLLHQQQQAEQLRALKNNENSEMKAQKKQEQPTEEQLKKLSLNETNTSQTALNHDLVNLTLVSENSATSTELPQPVAVNTETINLDEDDEEDEMELPPISAASMLTRKDIKEFKESVRRDNDAIIKVGSGETVTVRVPTHEDGRLIFWEFASDYYDLGFGLYFEWTISPSNNVTVHVSDSSDDEEGEEEEGKHDPEKGDKSNENKPPCDEIIPIFRRDCHEEVYAGSHLYPGRGVYLLKFDNSYSLWRSKTLYYRVYYSK